MCVCVFDTYDNLKFTFRNYCINKFNIVCMVVCFVYFYLIL